MNTRHLLLGGGLALVVGLILVDPQPRMPEVVVKTGKREATATSDSASGQPIAPLQPRSQAAATPTPHMRHLFARHSWTPLPPATPALEAPPMAPPLPFTYIGRQRSNGKWEVYLARGDDVLFVEANSVIDGVYELKSIDPNVLTFLYLPLQQTQTLAIQ